jgi:phosphoglycolate phosphatase-like HAD superfamily hydrolase
VAEAFELGYEPLGVRFVASAAVLLDACRDVGRPVVIVSNNAEPAIEAFLDHHDLRHLIDGAPANNRR